MTEAKKRLHHIYDTHDSVVVAFSGGKDSLATLHLTREIAAERGISRIPAVFRDEELIDDSVIQFVRSYLQEPWLDLAWWAVPLQSHKYVLGRMMDYVQWDPARKWVRPKPEWALTEKDLALAPGTVLSQYTADEVAASRFPGKVCILTGVRSAESLMRYRACVNKLNDNYIVASSSKRATLGRPIFDWEENDVFRFFYDRNIPYCPIYNAQAWSKYKLRVCSAICSEPAKNFGEFRKFAPDLYAAVIEVFPEMELQERYFGEMDREAVMRQFGQSLEGVRAWIEENIEDERQYAKAIMEFDSVAQRTRLAPASYPSEHVLRCFMSGGGKRRILPVKAANA